MSKSDDTKERIARTFLECMETTPYGKINVSQLCERAHISRKTFYYHFEDKERLVRWICIQDLIEWAHSDTSDGPSSYVSLISFFIEKNRILYGHALLDMTPGSFGQLFSDVLYYLIDGRLGRFYEESMADEELAHLSLAFAVDRGRMMASYWLLSDREPDAEELERYLYQEEVVNNQIIGRWLNKPKTAKEPLRPPESLTALDLEQKMVAHLLDQGASAQGPREPRIGLHRPGAGQHRAPVPTSQIAVTEPIEQQRRTRKRVLRIP